MERDAIDSPTMWSPEAWSLLRRHLGYVIPPLRDQLPLIKVYRSACAQDSAFRPGAIVRQNLRWLQLRCAHRLAVSAPPHAKHITFPRKI